jgi:hypothetical protein
MISIQIFLFFRSPNTKPWRRMQYAISIFSFKKSVMSRLKMTAPWRSPCCIFLALLDGMLSLPTLAAAAPAALASPAIVCVGCFDEGIQSWREVDVKAGSKRNKFRLHRRDDVLALEVTSNASMSLLARPLDLNLHATPVLCWRWRIDAPLKTADMKQRSGDDYAARLYVSFTLPEAEKSFGLRTKLKLARVIWGPDVPDAALNYVWDNRQPVGTELANAYTDRVMMVVLRSGADDAGRWVWERRNVGDEVARLFSAGALPVQLAITADTDNTGESARAAFADIHFVARNASCNSQQTR